MPHSRAIRPARSGPVLLAASPPAGGLAGYPASRAPVRHPPQPLLADLTLAATAAPAVPPRPRNGRPARAGALEPGRRAVVALRRRDGLRRARDAGGAGRHTRAVARHDPRPGRLPAHDRRDAAAARARPLD